jgi:hypothetical protein
MTNGKPVSLSTKQLSAEVKKAVDTALAKHKLQGVTRIDEGLTVASSGLIGFVLRDKDINQKTIADLNSIAGDVATSLKGATPAVLSKGGHIIIGFVPEPNITSLKE